MAKKKPRKRKTPIRKTRTIGVRFLQGENLHRVYTYEIGIKKKVTLGQELIADTPRGPSVAVVVRLDATFNPDDFPEHALKNITKRVAPL